MFLSGGYVFWKEAGSDESVFSLIGGYIIFTIPVTILMGVNCLRTDIFGYVNFSLLILVGVLYAGEMVWSDWIIVSRYAHFMDIRLWIQEQQ